MLTISASRPLDAFISTLDSSFGTVAPGEADPGILQLRTALSLRSTGLFTGRIMAVLVHESIRTLSLCNISYIRYQNSNAFIQLTAKVLIPPGGQVN